MKATWTKIVAIRLSVVMSYICHITFFYWLSPVARISGSSAHLLRKWFVELKLNGALTFDALEPHCRAKSSLGEAVYPQNNAFTFLCLVVEPSISKIYKVAISV